MEVRKEFMPGIVQEYNKSKQITASGEPSKVRFKGKLHPCTCQLRKDISKTRYIA
jgi:hypothetical protein